MHRHCVIVNDTVDTEIVFLQRDHVKHRPNVIADMEAPRWLDAAKDHLLRHGSMISGNFFKSTLQLASQFQLLTTFQCRI